MGIEGELQMERCHRVGKRQQESNRPRSIICKITKFKDKKFILINAKKLKDTGIFIYEDFNKKTSELRKTLWEQVLEYCQQKNLLTYITKAFIYLFFFFFIFLFLSTSLLFAIMFILVKKEKVSFVSTKEKVKIHNFETPI